MGVVIGPGLTTLMRIPRPINSVVSVRANERIAALVAE
jgi:hypothetical protein